jgi:hypothetical protein
VRLRRRMFGSDAANTKRVVIRIQIGAVFRILIQN